MFRFHHTKKVLNVLAIRFYLGWNSVTTPRTCIFVRIPSFRLPVLVKRKHMQSNS